MCSIGTKLDTGLVLLLTVEDNGFWKLIYHKDLPLWIQLGNWVQMHHFVAINWWFQMRVLKLNRTTKATQPISLLSYTIRIEPWGLNSFQSTTLQISKGKTSFFLTRTSRIFWMSTRGAHIDLLPLRPKC